MEHWHSSSIPPGVTDGEALHHRHRALTLVSGNRNSSGGGSSSSGHAAAVQFDAVDSKDSMGVDLGIENQDPHEVHQLPEQERHLEQYFDQNNLFDEKFFDRSHPVKAVPLQHLAQGLEHEQHWLQLQPQPQPQPQHTHQQASTPKLERSHCHSQHQQHHPYETQTPGQLHTQHIHQSRHHPQSRPALPHSHPYQPTLPSQPRPSHDVPHLPSQKLPSSTLASSAPQSLSKQSDDILRLNQRRRHSSNRPHFGTSALKNHSRPYLRHPKYLEYRARQRRDTGHDGKPVWDDVMEDAFQNALVHIAPMGRKKRPQHQKLYGRNELISEWILQETGQFRSRKQVSSHIQVLNLILKGIPEWNSLIIALNDDTGSANGGNGRGNAGGRGSGMTFYENSIEHQVQRLDRGKSRRHRQYPSHGYHQAQHHHQGQHISENPPPPAFTLGSNVHITNSISDVSNSKHPTLTGLDFEMWVSGPKALDIAIHTYTRLQTAPQQAGAPTLPLEDVRGWRELYPALVPIIAAWEHIGVSGSELSDLGGEKCELIRLSTSFQLMSDFPPPSSKLGISLELDFVPPKPGSGGNQNSYSTETKMKALASLSGWSCETHMYSKGRPVKDATLLESHVSDVGRVKPFFESKWWAARFTELTEAKRRVEDAGDVGGMERAERKAREFFDGLSVMQVVYARAGTGLKDEWVQWPGRKRMAILLWRFSQAQSPYVGTTTWQRLVPAPPRISTNSPQPVSEMELPPLAMDSVIEEIHVHGFDGHDLLAQYGGQHGGFGLIDEELCQGGFLMGMEGMAGFAGMHEGFDSGGHDLGDMGVFHFELHSHDMQGIQHHVEVQPEVTNGSLFESNHIHAQPLDMNYVQSGLQSQFQHDSEDDETRQPLSRFDVSTSKILQEQMQEHADRLMPIQQFHPDETNHTGVDAVSLARTTNKALEDSSCTNDPAATVMLNPELNLNLQAPASSISEVMNHHEREAKTYLDSSEQRWAAPVPTRPVLRSHASYLAEQEMHHGLPHSSTEDDGHSFANMSAYDANHLAAELAAHNAAVDHAASQSGEGGEQHNDLGRSFELVSPELFDALAAASQPEGLLRGSFVEVKEEESQ